MRQAEHPHENLEGPVEGRTRPLDLQLDYQHLENEAGRWTQSFAHSRAPRSVRVEGLLPRKLLADLQGAWRNPGASDEQPEPGVSDKQPEPSNSNEKSDASHRPLIPPPLARQLRWPHLHRHLLSELSSGTFIDFLERVSGITNLLPDPLLHQAGFQAEADTATPRDSHIFLPDYAMESALQLTVPLLSDGEGEIRLFSSAQEEQPDQVVNVGPGQALLLHAEPGIRSLVSRHGPASVVSPAPALLVLYYYRLRPREQQDS